MKTRVKIFVDAHCFDKGYQGIRSFVKGIYSGLASSDTADIYLGAFDVTSLKAEFPDILPGHFIRYKSKNSLIRLGFEIPAILKKHKFDYAHFQYVSPLRKHCRYIVTTHDILFKDYKHEFPWRYRMLRDVLFRYSLKRADIKSTPSVYSAERLSFYYRLPSAEVHVISNGVDGRFFSSEFKMESAEFIRTKYECDDYILCVNRIEPRKNQALLLQAFLELELYKQGISLIFIGEPAIAYPVFSKKMRLLPADARGSVRHFPGVSEADLLHFYRASRVLVYPSLAEGFGIPPLEAAALKVPVLCANTTAMSQYSFFRENLFDPRNLEELKTKLIHRLSGGREDQNLDRISAFIRENYSWEEGRHKLLDCITKLPG